MPLTLIFIRLKMQKKFEILKREINISTTHIQGVSIKSIKLKNNFLELDAFSDKQY